MNHRRMLYGYQYRMGEPVICRKEAETVKRVFALYLADFSYQKIADILNGDHVPFSEENAFWNKHKIKRLLENPRYAGADGYPPITDSDTFQTVRAMIHEKGGNSVKAAPRPVFQLRPFLICAHCGKALRMDSIGDRDSDQIRLKCGTCGIQFDLSDAELVNPVTAQMADRQNHSHENAYEPSEEVMRLTNAVNRALEHPDNPDDIVSLILQGVSARYDCCPNPDSPSPDSWPGLDEQQLHQQISHITAAKDSAITVHFQAP